MPNNAAQLCHNRGVSASLLQTLLTTCALLAGAVFVASFKLALKEVNRNRCHPFEPELPRAQLHELGKHPDNPWHRGAKKYRFIRFFQLMQAGFVAIGITSIFVMFLCMAGIVSLMVLGTW